MGCQTIRHEIPNQMVLFTDHLFVFFNIRHIPLKLGLKMVKLMLKMAELVLKMAELRLKMSGLGLKMAMFGSK